MSAELNSMVDDDGKVNGLCRCVDGGGEEVMALRSTFAWIDVLGLGTPLTMPILSINWEELKNIY